MSNDGTQQDGKKNLDLDHLDKVVGGAGIADLLKGPKNLAQQVADTLAEIEAAKAKALAPAPTAPLPATDVSVKSMDSEIAKLGAKASIDDIVKVVKANPAAAVHGLAELAKTNPNAMASLEGMARVNTKGALSALESLARAKAPGAFEALGDVALGKMSVRANDMVKALIQAAPTTTISGILTSTGSAWGVLEQLGKTVPEAKPFIEKMASNGAGMALTVLDKIGDQAFIAKLAKEGGGLATTYVFDRLSGGNPFYQNLAEDLVRSGAKNALDKIEELARGQNSASWSLLDKLVKADVKPAFQALEDLAIAKQPRAVSMLQTAAEQGVSGALASLEAVVRKGAAPVEAIENLARRGYAGAYDALDHLAADNVPGALGAMSRITQYALNEVKSVLDSQFAYATRMGQPRSFDLTFQHCARQLQQGLKLDAGSAMALVKAQAAILADERANGTGKFVTAAWGPSGFRDFGELRNEASLIRGLIGGDVNTTVKGLSLMAGMGGDAEKSLRLITNLVAEGAPRIGDMFSSGGNQFAGQVSGMAQSVGGMIGGAVQSYDFKDANTYLNAANAAVEEGQALAKKTRIGAAVFNVADNPTDVDAYKRLIAEGALMAATPSSAGKAMHAISAFNELAYCSTAGKVFDQIGIDSQVRQAAKAMTNMVDNLQNAFVDTYTKGVLNPAFDMAQHAGENCYALGKAIASGNVADMGNAMGTLAKDLTADYINSVKAYYVDGGGAALAWGRDVVANFLSDTGAMQYAGQAADFSKDVVNELGNLAKDGSEAAAKELVNLANNTAQFGRDAANELRNVYNELPPQLRGPINSAISSVISVGGPAATYIYGGLVTSGNIVGGGIVSGANQVKDWGESAVNWVGDNLKFW